MRGPNYEENKEERGIHRLHSVLSGLKGPEEDASFSRASHNFLIYAFPPSTIVIYIFTTAISILNQSSDDMRLSQSLSAIRAGNADFGRYDTTS